MSNYAILALLSQIPIPYILYAMITTHTHRGLVWVDLQSPSDKEVSDIVKKYNLNPLVGEELKDSPSPAKVNFFKDYILVVLTLPVRIHSGSSYEIVDREVNFIIGKNFLITSKSETVEQLEYFAKIFDANAALDKENSIEHAGHLFYYMVQRIYNGMHQDLENIRDALRTAESHIFNGDERKMVEVLSFLSRELIDFKQTAHGLHDVWTDFTSYTEKAGLFSAEFFTYIHSIKEESNHINEKIVNSRELLADLRETNDALLNTKQNEIIKVLTLVSFIFYPLTFIASVFTITGVDVPLTKTPDGWWIICGIMLVVAVGIAIYFQKRGWVK